MWMVILLVSLIGIDRWGQPSHVGPLTHMMGVDSVTVGPAKLTAGACDKGADKVMLDTVNDSHDNRVHSADVSSDIYYSIYAKDHTMFVMEQS